MIGEGPGSAQAALAFLLLVSGALFLSLPKDQASCILTAIAVPLTGWVCFCEYRSWKYWKGKWK